MAGPRLVMVDPHQVHDLSSKCPEMITLCRELGQGRGCYTPVKALQARVYKIPGCTTCFGSELAFRALLSKM